MITLPNLKGLPLMLLSVLILISVAGFAAFLYRAEIAALLSHK